MMVPLAKMNAVSQRELIAAKSSYNPSTASLKSSRANLDNAKIELGYCRILAPISGLIGISKVIVGDYVKPEPDSVLNTISDLGDVRVRFTMSEREFLRIFIEIKKQIPIWQEQESFGRRLELEILLLFQHKKTRKLRVFCFKYSSKSTLLNLTFINPFPDRWRNIVFHFIQ